MTPTFTLTTTLRLASGYAVPIVIERDAGSHEWNPVTIDGMTARIWLDENDLQCGKGETSNHAERQRRNTTEKERHERTRQRD